MNLSGISRVITQALGLYDALNKPFSMNPPHNTSNQQMPYNGYVAPAPNYANEQPINRGTETIKQYYAKKIKDFLNQKI